MPSARAAVREIVAPHRSPDISSGLCRPRRRSCMPLPSHRESPSLPCPQECLRRISRVRSSAAVPCVPRRIERRFRQEDPLPRRASGPEDRQGRDPVSVWAHGQKRRVCLIFPLRPRPNLHRNHHQRTRTLQGARRRPRP